MKITCEYCGALFDDYMAKCPSCAAPNKGVVRTTSDEPLTIEELENWYKSKGLPPYETTRFFIGVDYKEPRAFGIYRDENTGNVVVYKNKDNGERAIRYEGTDEAYGVNELFQRLKQEIIQQKMNNVKKGNVNNTYESSSDNKSEGSCLGSLGWLFLVLAGGAVLLFGGLFAIGSIILAVTPKDGYYNYQNEYYYYNDKGYNDKYVFEYDDNSGKWLDPVAKDSKPGIFNKKRECDDYFLSENWDASFGCTDINDSLNYQDYLATANIEPGYYSTNSGYYYHYGYNYDSDWYYYDDYSDWVAVDKDSLPVDLSHASTVNDFYYTPTWDASTQITDFTESAEYEANYADKSSDSSDSDYSWDSSDSWDSNDTDFSSDW